MAVEDHLMSTIRSLDRVVIFYQRVDDPTLERYVDDDGRNRERVVGTVLAVYIVADTVPTGPVIVEFERGIKTEQVSLFEGESFLVTGVNGTDGMRLQVLK